jgi:hypothetical protein
VIEEHADRILEAGLEEVLGGRYPPDLTSAILQAWEARQQSAARMAWVAGDDAVSPDAVAALPVPPPVHPLVEPVPPPWPSEDVVRIQPAHPVRRDRDRRWLALAVAASFLAVTGLLSLYAARHWNQPAGRIIAQPGPNVPIAGDPASVRPPTDMPERPRGRVPVRADAQQTIATAAPSRQAETSTGGLPPDSANPASPPDMPRASPRRQPSADADVIAFINDVLKRGWREHSVTPSPPVTEEEWCDRVYRQLVGRRPTGDETKQFLRQREKDRSHRRALVDRLLASDEHARHWAQSWATALVGPIANESADDTFSREELVSYLAAAVRSDRPQEQVVFELLSATGANQPGAEDHNGAVNFLLAGAKDNAAAATNRTSRVFLGKQLVCTSCHDHAAGAWEQGEFWQLNAFFRQMTIQRDREAQRTVLTDRDFAGASGAAKDAELFYRLPDGRLGMAYPEFDGQTISHSGLVSDVNRRRELAKLVVASDDFRLATVNRIWSWLFGYGFTQPVDDMGPHNPPSHPELLDRLADELAAHDFDTKGLVRWIVLSEPFGLSGKRTPESWMDAPESGGQPLFARYYARENGARDNRAKENGVKENGVKENGATDSIANGGGPVDVSRMLVQAVHRRPAAAPAGPGALARRTWLRPSVEPVEIIETQPDTQWPGPAWLPRLAHSSLPPEKKIEHLFLSVLDRRPTSRELTAAKLVLADRLGDPSAIREIWRTLLASQSAIADAGQR